LKANLVAVEFEEAIDTLRELIDHNKTLSMPRGTRLTNIFRDSPNQDMRECFQKCIVDKDGFYDG
jgi:hypothetical protein